MDSQARYKLILNRLPKLLGCTLLITLVAGCASAPPPAGPQAAAAAAIETTPAPHPSGPLALAGRSIASRLRAEVQTWRKTPHKMGGTSRRGVDCSGFVQQVYQETFRRSIPRTTALQVKSGRPVPRSRIRPGDLVFFRPPHKVRHVGIYLGGGQFAHASTSRGVIISSLSEGYWRQCYWTARRYLARP
jgi:cell wall-associated NlpC family hydrolase